VRSSRTHANRAGTPSTFPESFTMTPSNRTTLNALIALSKTPIDTSNQAKTNADVWNRFNIVNCLTLQSCPALDPVAAGAFSALKNAFEAGSFQESDVTGYQDALAILQVQVTRANRVLLGVPVEPL
jgi:hypothetical protein